MKFYIMAGLLLPAAVACAQGPFNGGAVSQTERETRNASSGKHLLGITSTSLTLQWAQYSDTLRVFGTAKVPATDSALFSADFQLGSEWGFGGWVSGHHESFQALSVAQTLDTYTNKAVFWEIHFTRYIHLKDPSSSLSLNAGYERAEWKERNDSQGVDLGTVVLDMFPIYASYSTAVGDRPDSPLRVGGTVGIVPSAKNHTVVTNPSSYVVSVNVSYRLSKNMDLVATGYKQAYSEFGVVQRVTAGLCYRF